LILRNKYSVTINFTYQFFQSPEPIVRKSRVCNAYELDHALCKYTYLVPALLGHTVKAEDKTNSCGTRPLSPLRYE